MARKRRLRRLVIPKTCLLALKKASIVCRWLYKVEQGLRGEVQIGEQHGQLAPHLADHAARAPVQGTVSNPDILGMTLPLQLVLANDLLHDLGVPQFQNEPDTDLEQSVQGGVRDAVSGVESDHELGPSGKHLSGGRPEWYSRRLSHHNNPRCSIGMDPPKGSR
jgi:hypothetical protein